jgi:tellurite resistance protein TerC
LIYSQNEHLPVNDAVVQIPTWGWVTFGIAVIVLLAIDHVAHRGERAASRRVALAWSGIWIAAGLLFNVFVGMVLGPLLATEYLATYLIEKVMSMDNMFLFLIIFDSLQIPKESQYRALFWGIVGAVAFRGLLIFLGSQALAQWQWITYIFGVIILYAAYRALRKEPGKNEKSRLVEFLSKRLPITENTHRGQFFARESGHLNATPLLLALIAIEITDVMMAVDSVAVAFSMTRNNFVIYTSNVFAILGLRALYLLLAHTITGLRYLHYGLAIVLAFAGIKLLADPIIHIPPLVSVIFTIVAIGTSIGISLRKQKSRSR